MYVGLMDCGQDGGSRTAREGPTEEDQHHARFHRCLPAWDWSGYAFAPMHQRPLP
jgi:hypothetical protein